MDLEDHPLPPAQGFLGRLALRLTPHRLRVMGLRKAKVGHRSLECRAPIVHLPSTKIVGLLGNTCKERGRK